MIESIKESLSQRDVVADMGIERQSSSDTTTSQEITLRSEHYDDGRHVATALDGQLLDVGYVDSRAIVAHHESVSTDQHMRVAETVHSYIQDDDHTTASALAKERIGQTAIETEALLKKKKEEDENDVFGRTLRQVTTIHGSESILRLKSIPDWSLAQANAHEMNEAIQSNLAFVIPKDLAEEIKETFEYYSAMDVSNSLERTKGTIITERSRGGGKELDMYTTLPITIDGRTLQLYFIYGDTIGTKVTETTAQAVTEELELLAKETGHEITEIESMDEDAQYHWFWETMSEIIRAHGSMMGESAYQLLQAEVDTLVAAGDEGGVSPTVVRKIKSILVQLGPQLRGAVMTDLSSRGAAGLWDGTTVSLDPDVLADGDIQYVSHVRTHEEYHKENNHHLPLRSGSNIQTQHDAAVYRIGGILFSPKELKEAINTLDVDTGTFEQYTDSEYRRYAEKLWSAAKQLTTDRLQEIRYAINVSKDLSMVDDNAADIEDAEDDGSVASVQEYQLAHASNTNRMKEGVAKPNGTQTRAEALPKHSSTVEDMAA